MQSLCSKCLHFSRKDLHLLPCHIKISYGLITRKNISTGSNHRSEVESRNNDRRERESLPKEPTNCCMSGCPNCVWLEYADSLKRHYIDGHAQAREAIEKEVQDPSLKAFLLFELQLKEN